MDGFALHATRRLGSDRTMTRDAVMRALLGAGFEVSRNVPNRLSATRTPKAGIMSREFPIEVTVGFARFEKMTDVYLRVADSSGAGVVKGLLGNSAQDTLQEVVRVIDDALSKLGNEVTADVPEVLAPGALSTVTSTLRAHEQSLPGFLGRTLLMRDEKDRTRFVFRSPRGTAVLSGSTLDSSIVLGEAIVQRKGLPEDLADSLDDLVLRMWLASADRSDSLKIEPELSESATRAFEFLDEQVRLRTALPQRIVQTCLACGNQTTMNRDFREATEKADEVTRGVGAFSGFMMVGSVAGVIAVANRLLFDPRSVRPTFVCRRCEGMECDELIVSICPVCRKVVEDPVLGKCPHCGENLHSLCPTCERFLSDQDLKDAAASANTCAYCCADLAAALREPVWLTEQDIAGAIAAEPTGEIAELVRAGMVAYATCPPVAPPGSPPVSQNESTPAPSPASWYADPRGRHQHRYFDGAAWTSFVADAGVQSLDPL